MRARPPGFVVVALAYAGFACTPEVPTEADPPDAFLEEDMRAATGGSGGSGGGGGGVGSGGQGGSGSSPDAAADAAPDRAPAAPDVAVVADVGSEDALEPIDAALDAPPRPGAVPGVWMGAPGIVAVGDDGRCAMTVDGKTWPACPGTTTPAKGSAGDRQWRRAAYANQTLVAVAPGSCDLATAKCTTRIGVFDGKQFKAASVPDDVGRVRAVAYGGGVWVAVGTLGPVLYSVDNAATWQKTVGVGTAQDLLDVEFGRVGEGEIFLAVGEKYVRAMSRDGINWTETHKATLADALDDLAIGNGVAVAVGGSSTSGVRMRTTNGKDWTDVRMGGPDLLSVHFADGRFVAFTGTSANTIHVSADGGVDSWSTMVGTMFLNGTQMVPAQPERIGVVRIDGKVAFIGRRSVSGQPTDLRSSTDALNWTSLYREANESAFQHFTYASGM